MLYPAQIRAARALLGWHQIDLAQKAKVGLATIQRLEQGPDGPVLAHYATVVLKCTLFRPDTGISRGA